MQYINDHLSYQNKYNLLLFIKSVAQLDTSNLKFKFHTISAVKFSMLIKRIFSFCILFLCFLDASGKSLELTLAEYAEKPFGNVIFLRHAFAPGFDANGEPDKFEIDDCSTQRNLSTIGRKQAAKIGKKFLIKPKDWIKGTKMSFAGLKNPKERAAVILYMNNNTTNPLPLN